MLLSDDLLLNYKRCCRRTFLETYGDLREKEPAKDFVQKLREENQLHIDTVLHQRDYIRLKTPRGDLEAGAKETLSLMQQGVDCIYEGVLFLPSFEDLKPWFRYAAFPTPSFNTETFTFVATPTLLVKQPGQSKFGDWQYIPISIKLGRRPKPEYQIVAAFQAVLLAAVQESWSDNAQIILRRDRACSYFVNLRIWMLRMAEVLSACLEMLSLQQEPEVFISRQRCSLCQWYRYCHDLAVNQQHLSLVPGVTPARYESLQKLNIHTLESLAQAPFDQISQALGSEIALNIQRQALANFLNQPLEHHKLQKRIPTASIELYFDIEAEPERNLDYLLGVLLVNRTTHSQRFYAFLAENLEEEGIVWQQFVNFVCRYSTAPIFHYSEYEVETIKRLAKLYQTPRSQVNAILSRCVDVHAWVTNSVTLPVESYSLKSVAQWLGFSWRDPEGSGDQSVCWYDQWLKSGDRALLDAILRYNEDDCRATHHLKDWLVNFLMSASA